MRKPVLLLAFLLLLTASVFTVSRAADPTPILATCDCSAQILSPQTGLPQKGVKFFVKVHSSVVSGQLVQPKTFNTSTDSAGVAHIQVVQGAKVTISGEHPNFATPVTRNWPSTSTCSLVTLFGIPLPSAVFGAGSSTNNAIVRWDDVTGAAIKNSAVTVSDTGKITGATTGQAFESLENALEGATGYRVQAFQRGTSGMSAETSSDPYLNYQVHQNNNGSGTLFNYFFSAETHQGSRDAIYNLTAVMKAHGTQAKDRVALAALGYALAGTTDRVWGFYVQTENNSTTGTALNEFLCYNTSGAQAQTAVSGLTPASLGLSIVGATQGVGSLNNSAALTISAQGSGAFLTGIYFYNGSVAAGSTAIDLSALGAGFALPIRLPNNSPISALNAANNANKSLIRLNTSNQVSIDLDGGNTIFGAGIRPGVGAFVANTAQLYRGGGTGGGGLIITAGSNDSGVGGAKDLLIAARDGTTLISNPASTASLELSTQTAGYVYINTPNAAVVDANIAAGAMAIYLNEAGNLLTFRIRYSTGVLHTVTIAIP